MLFPQKQIDQYQASIEFKVMVVAFVAIVICVAMGVSSILRGDASNPIQERSAAWHLFT